MLWLGAAANVGTAIFMGVVCSTRPPQMAMGPSVCKRNAVCVPIASLLTDLWYSTALVPELVNETGFVCLLTACRHCPSLLLDDDHDDLVKMALLAMPSCAGEAGMLSDENHNAYVEARTRPLE